MSKAGKKILAGARQALAYVSGEPVEGTVVHPPDKVDVKAIREGLGLTQKEFADRFGFELAALRNWEQNRRNPEGPARVLLTVIEKEPEAVTRALAKPKRRVSAPKRRSRTAA